MIDYGKPTGSQPGMAGKSVKARGKLSALKVTAIVIAAVVALAVLLLAAGCLGYYLYNDHFYKSAETNIKQHEYNAAMDDLSKTVAFFRDSRKLMLYAQAGQALQAKDFPNAKQFYADLAGFRDSGVMTTETDYQHAQYLLEKQSFDEARKLFETLGAYKDSKSMLQETDYKKAGFLLSKGEFVNAKALFEQLGDYKDSRQMVTETDYQNAMGFLQSKQYSNAETYFSQLAGQHYKDAAAMLLETKYQYAKDMYQKGQYLDALNKIREVGLYKDGSTLADEIGKMVYSQGVQLYRAGRYSTAQSNFDEVPTYSRSQDYQLLITAHFRTDYDEETDVAGMRKIYNRLKALGSFEDADDLRTSDAFIYFRLEGNWKGSGYMFSMYYDAKKKSWYVSYTIPYIDGKYFDIKGCILSMGSDDKGWKKNFKFVFLSENKMQVYCYKTGRTYTLTR